MKDAGGVSPISGDQEGILEYVSEQLVGTEQVLADAGVESAHVHQLSVVPGPHKHGFGSVFDPVQLEHPVGCVARRVETLDLFAFRGTRL